MRKFAIAVALAVFALPAYAQSTTTAGSQSGAISQSGVNIAGSARQAPNAIAPGLIASGLSCSGSAALGAAGSGWGLSLGLTKEDRACNAREDAKYIHGTTGSINAAKARLCMQKENREAFRMAGEPCPQDVVRSAASSPELRSSQPQVTRVRSFSSVAACEKWVRENGVNAQCRAR